MENKLYKATKLTALAALCAFLGFGVVIGQLIEETAMLPSLTLATMAIVLILRAEYLRRLARKESDNET